MKNHISYPGKACLSFFNFTFSVTIFTFFSILFPSMFVFSFSFLLWRRWQFPGYALISLLYCTLRCHQRHGRMVTQHWQQLLKGTKKSLTRESRRSVAVKLTLAASHLESLHISWSNYHCVLLPGRCGRQIFGGDGETC